MSVVRVCLRCHGWGWRRGLSGIVDRCSACRGRGVLERQTIGNAIRQARRALRRRQRRGVRGRR